MRSRWPLPHLEVQFFTVDCDCVADWLGSLWSQKVTQTCGYEVAISASVDEVRRLRKEGSISILEHLDEGEKQSNPIC